MSKKSKSSTSKTESFDSLFGSVKPMKNDRVMPYQKKIDTIPKQRLADEQHVMDELLASTEEESSFFSGDEIKFIRDGYSPRLIKELRRGDYAIEASLDLHGMFSDEAKINVHGFINECAHDGTLTVRIIHGKGNHSKGKKPVLKNLILGWLKKNQFVIAVCSTPKNDGSTGAVYVRLKNG